MAEDPRVRRWSDRTQRPDWIPPAVQAIDPTPTPIDGTIDAFSIVRALADVNVLDITPGTIDPAAAISLRAT
jgi:hypothetical protein